MCNNPNNCEQESDIIIADTGGALRAVLMDMGDFLIDLCQELNVEEIKLNVSQNYDTGDVVFKAKVDGNKVLEITANDFVPYIG